MVEMRLQEQVLIDSMIDGVVALDRDERVMTINRAAAAMMGVEPRDVVGRTLKELGARPVLLHGESLFLRRCLDTGERFANVEGTWDVRGTMYLFQGSISPVMGSDGTVTGLVVVFEDVTEKRLLQEKLKHSDRLALLGEFCAEVLHEVRNPLSSILGALELLECSSPKACGRRDLLSVMERNVGEMDRFLNHLLSFAVERRDVYFRPVDVVKLLQEMLMLLKTRARSARVRLATDFRDEELWVQGGSMELKQVFLNIILNAIEAMPDGGELQIIGFLQADAVCLEFADTGAGIAPENLSRVGQQFFTTKEEGTGIGLVVVRRILDEHRGSFAIASGEDGTKVTVQLPRWFVGRG